jgi:hypothetical protein
MTETVPSWPGYRVWMRRLAAACLALLVLAIFAPGAGGQDTRALSFEHDGTRDGTSTEIHSGLYAGDPASGDPIAARRPNTFETFDLTVPDGTRHASLSTTITWADARVNLDLSVYRLGPDGKAIGPAVARSATTGRASETAVYAPQGATVEPGNYVVVVDNVCSRDLDDDPRLPGYQPVNCGAGNDVADEDDFSGTATLGNQIPQVTIAGPDSTPAKQSTTFEAIADDLDGTIASYQFDLNGDGTYELDTDGSAKVATSFATRGPHTIGVQVIDDAGAVALASKTINVTAAIKKPDTRPPLTSFTLSGTSFGGPTGHSLVISYKLREKSRVEVKLRRGGKLVRLIDRGVRRAAHRYRIVLRASHLPLGVYTVRIFVASASGKHQVVQRSSRRR